MKVKGRSHNYSSTAGIDLFSRRSTWHVIAPLVVSLVCLVAVATRPPRCPRPVQFNANCRHFVNFTSSGRTDNRSLGTTKLRRASCTLPISTRRIPETFHLALRSALDRPSQRMFSSKSRNDNPYDSDSKTPGPDASRLTHVDHAGRAQMVNVRQKDTTNRLAVAQATVNLGPQAFHLVKENKLRKGDALTVAQLAGIMACKSTSSLIPLCHNIPITHADVTLDLVEHNHSVQVTGSVDSIGRTGVEMEALTAVCVASLTLYDMCKAVSRDITITDVRLVRKSGGKSGDYDAEN